MGRYTNRLAVLRAEHYDNESYEEALSAIAEKGTSNIHVLGDEHSLSWSYSTGMYDTWGQPEIIMTGFPRGLAGGILYQIAQGNERGEFIQPEVRVPGLIGKVDCIFRPVAEVWALRLMLRTVWFYGEDAKWPVMQCICPDFENRFPWEAGFDESWRPRQALLQSDTPNTPAEVKLWNASSSELVN